MLSHQTILGLNHVVIAIARKFCAKSIRRLTQLAMTNSVGQDDVIATGIKRLPFTEQFTTKGGASMLAPARLDVATGGMQRQLHEHGAVSIRTERLRRLISLHAVFGVRIDLHKSNRTIQGMRGTQCLETF